MSYALSKSLKKVSNLVRQANTNDLPNRISAHALICSLALALYSVLRMRLKEVDNRCSYPPRKLGEGRATLI